MSDNNIYYTYILETIAKNNKKRFYTGYTNNLNRRLQEHKKGTGAKFCRGKKKIQLKYYELFKAYKQIFSNFIILVFYLLLYIFLFKYACICSSGISYN